LSKVTELVNIKAGNLKSHRASKHQSWEFENAGDFNNVFFQAVFLNTGVLRNLLIRVPRIKGSAFKYIIAIMQLFKEN
jgi:hypothetical protein